jgi:hypothetical protein
MNAPVLIPPVIPAHPQSPYGDWLKGFPLRSFLELGAYENAPASARGHARNVLAEWGLAAFADAVCLVISEMVTNSMRATRKVLWEGGLPPVRMWLLGGAGAGAAGQVMILVWDAVAEPPVPQAAAAEDVSGRGLGIVDWLSGGQWGCYLPAAPYGGKVTWALIDRPWRNQPPR